MGRASSIPADGADCPKLPAVGATSEVEASPIAALRELFMKVTRKRPSTSPTSTEAKPFKKNATGVDVSPFPFHDDMFDAYIQRTSHDVGVTKNPSIRKLSRKLCFVLRWGAPSLQLPISKDGYVNLKDLRALNAFAHYTDAVVRQIVRNDTKRRFALQEDEDGTLKVRANHGHGIPGVEVIERDLTLHDAVGYAVHVTSYYAWSKIRYEGLKRGQRGHVHFVGRAPSVDEEVAGVRNGGEVCVFVDVQRAMYDGIPFGVTPSRIIVSPGNEDGLVSRFT